MFRDIEVFGYPTDEQIYMRDTTDPVNGDINAAVYDLIDELRGFKIIDKQTPTDRWFINEGHPESPLRYLNLGSLVLKGLTTADFSQVLSAAENLAQKRNLQIVVHHDVGHSYMIPVEKLTESLKEYFLRNGDFPQVLGFTKLSSSNP